MNRIQKTAFAGLILLAASTVPAQENFDFSAYRDSRLLNSHSRIIFQARVIFGVEAQFSNLGEVGYPEDTEGDSNGDYIDYVFNDGYINIVDDESTMSSEFQFSMDNAVVGNDGYVESFTLSRYRSSASDEVYTDDSSSLSSGWEFAYQYEWGTRQDRLRYGFIAGFAINNLDFDTSQVVNGEFFRQIAEVTLDGPRISYEEGATYTGTSDGPSIDLGSDLIFDPEIEQLVTQDVWGEGEVVVPSEVTSWIEHDGTLANLRLGPLVNYHLGNKVHLQASAGVNLTYYYSSISVSETLNNMAGLSDYSVYTNSNSGDWLFGIYTEAAAYYYINNRTAAYGSLQIFRAENPSTDSVEGVDFEVNLKDSIIFSLGIKLAL